MAIVVQGSTVTGLAEVLRVMRTWQRDGDAVPLHPGDIGWNFRFGAQATADAVRTWQRGDTLLAVGFDDSPGLVRLAIAPEAQDDEEFTDHLVADLSTPDRGVLPEGDAAVELRTGDLARRRLVAAGWQLDESWTPLVRDLAEPVEDPGVRIEPGSPDHVADRVAVQRAAFETSKFTVDAWQAMAAGPAYADARCLVAYDDAGHAVAATTVWGAGPGRPGLIEPLGAHRDHRGHGHGRAITIAAAAALQDLGASSAIVCTPTVNAGGVAAYRSAGFTELPEVRDLRRPG